MEEGQAAEEQQQNALKQRRTSHQTPSTRAHSVAVRVIDSHTHPHYQQSELNRTSGGKPTVAEVLDYNNSNNRGVKSGSVTQTRFYTHNNSNKKRSSTRASDMPSAREHERMLSSFNGPQMSPNEPFQTKMSELTSDRISK